MTTLEAPPTLADAIEAAGGIPPERIVLDPPPGTATEAHVEMLAARGLNYELVEGTLLRKMMGKKDDRWATMIVTFLNVYAMQHRLGVVGSSQALIRLAPGLVRMPDACFTPWAALEGDDDETFQDVPPTLVVEVISPSNTKAEIRKKLGHYAAAGVTLAWVVDGRREEVDVYANADVSAKVTLTTTDTLEAGAACPGFTLPVKAIFAEHRP
jgi:Uma2 family endonuclease